MTKMSTNETAKYLGVSTSFLNKKRTAGGGPKYYKISPKKVVYDSKDCDQWLASRLLSSTADLPPARRRRRVRDHVATD